MKTIKISLLDLAVRVFPVLKDIEPRSRARREWPCPDAMFVFDAETRIDETQRLTFGSYRFLENGRCTREGLFYADDLPEADLKVLERYVSTHRAETAVDWRLRLFKVSDFVSQLYQDAFRGRCLVVGFNLPFDLSRIARDFAAARGRFAGGFSLQVWSYFDQQGVEHANNFRPRICIKHIDSKRALKGFTARNKPDKDDLVPEGSESGEPEAGYKFRGHFLDLRTLAFALTDRSYTLAGACEAYGVEHTKHEISQHGTVTEEYIDYNRRDVLATEELAKKLLAEFEKHPVSQQATKMYSPASLGKAYLRAMGIKPILERQPKFPRKFLGYAQSAFFGGRTSAHIRKVCVPVVYVDFLSMYPSVNTLMGLDRFLVAQEIRIVEGCVDEIGTFLQRLTPDSLFKPATWKLLPAFVRIIPDGDILTSRSQYNLESNDWQVAVNHLYADENSPRKQELWFSLPDVVASVLLSGKIPRIVDAFRIEPHGTQPGLGSTKLYGEVKCNPRRHDFFKLVIEERKRLSSRRDLSQAENDRLDRALKVLANATSYGIFAEMIRQETDEKVNVTCHGIDPEPRPCRVTHPDQIGEYCFPPLASLITGAARLMLALLEHCVTELGGTYAMEDTDSMAIVATKKGGMVPCPSGPGKTGDSEPAVKALTWEQVQLISERFAALNPYDRKVVPGSILKIEDDNFDPSTGRQHQLYCFAISAKRYALFLKDREGHPALLRKGVNNKKDRWSLHGLGHLLNPIDPENEDRDWTAQAWLNIIKRGLGLPTQPLSFEHLPAVGRVTVSSPGVMRAFSSFNEGKPYCEKIKPFNFVLTCQVKQLGHPTGTDPAHFHLIAPYDKDPRRWLKANWIDQYTGTTYRITTQDHGDRKTARVKTYGDILREYEFHAEPKCADVNEDACGKQTVGLLQRRHIQIELIRYIGKESNKLDDVEAGMIHSAQSVYTEYGDRRRDEWDKKILPAVKEIPLSELVKMSGLPRRTLIDLRAGRSRPRRKNWELLANLVRDLVEPQEN